MEKTCIASPVLLTMECGTKTMSTSNVSIDSTKFISSWLNQQKNIANHLVVDVMVDAHATAHRSRTNLLDMSSTKSVDSTNTTQMK